VKGLILTYALTYGGAAVALVNPFVGVCVYWMFDIVRPQYMFAWAGAQGSFSEIIALGTVAGWAFKRFGTWQFGRGKIVVALFAANGVWVLLSALFAPDHAVALGFVVEQLKRTLMFTIAVTTADSFRRVEQLAWVLVGSAGYLSFELNMRYFGGANEAQRFGYGGMDNNSLAISLVTCLGVAVFLGLSARRSWQKGLALGSAALIAHTILLTFSRGGMLGMIVAGIAAVVVIPKKPRYLVPMAAAVMLVLSLAGPEVRARFMTSFAEDQSRDYSAQSRVDLWMDCLEIMKKYPIFGAGPDHFGLVVAEFGWSPGKEAHSLWLQLGAEIGIPGVLLLLLFYLAIVRRVWPLRRNDGTTAADHWMRNTAFMVVTSLAGFMFSVQFVTMEGLETPLYVAAIAVGTLRLVPERGGLARPDLPALDSSRLVNPQFVPGRLARTGGRPQALTTSR
jgi:probable O-glycosylation ligase (exosortase A-associated)